MNTNSDVDEGPARIGDNSGDPHAIAFDQAREKLDAFLSGAAIWEKRGAWSDAELAAADLDDLGARLNDFITGSRRLWKNTDEARAAEKKPHDDAAKAVQAKWSPMLKKIEAVGDVGKKLAARILKIQAARAAEARAKAEAERRAAEEKAREAERRVEEAATIKERLEAQEIADAHRETATLKAAEEKEASEPVKLASATGTANRRGLRTKWTARLVSPARALAAFRDHPDVAALLITLAERALRDAPVIDGKKQMPEIPGIEFVESQEV